MNFLETYLNKFLKLGLFTKIFIVSTLIVFAGSFIDDKPSVCDCNTVMTYGDGSVDAAKRILGEAYGAEFMRRSQNECGLKYLDEIEKWQTDKGISGSTTDNAMEYFMEKCK